MLYIRQRTTTFRLWRLLVVIVLGTVSLSWFYLVSNPVLSQSSSNWTTYQHDSRHSGLSSFIGPQTNDARQLYDSEVGTYLYSSPVVGPSGLIYFTKDHTNPSGWTLVALHPDGSLAFESPQYPGNSQKIPTIADDGTIYVPAFPLGLYAFFPNGSFKWNRPFVTHVESVALGNDGTVYVSSGFWQPGADVLVALNPDGTTKWTYQYSGVQNLQPAAVAPNGNVIVSDNGGYWVAAHDPTNGNQLWRTNLLGPYPGALSPPAIAPDGTIYVFFNRLWALSPDGQIQWMTPFIPALPLGSTPAIAADGTIVFATNDSSSCGEAKLFSYSASGEMQRSTDLTQGLGFIYPQVALDAEGSAYVSFGNDGCGSAICPSLPLIFSVNNTGTVRWSYSAAYANEIHLGGPHTAYATVCTSGTCKIVAFESAATPTPAPSISSISPSSPIANNSDQNVTVHGSNFQQNLTVSVRYPGSACATTLSGTQIQSVTTGSFVMRITLAAPGNWSIRVNNPNGGQSETFAFNVLSGVQQPAIFSINPTTPVAGATDQDVIVSGANFQQNLQVPITPPSGGPPVILSGAQIQNVTSTSFIMRATLNAAGSWTIRVTNPDGGQSSAFPFNVSGGGNNPVILSVDPPSPITNGADQNVTVNGSGFQNGLLVNVTFPGGGVRTLQGNGQIQNVSANSFLMRITLNATGSWTIRVINPDNSQSQQYMFSVRASGPPPTGLPTSVLSPVIGPLRVTSTNQHINDGKWEFNQYKTGTHSPNGGISLSNDTFAWDANLYTQTSGNADAGKAVFAVADGVVVRYVGTPPGSGPGAVLIAHPNAQNPVWFSGYLHMTNVRVTLNQQVNVATLIGEVGRVGADNDNLHFVIYSGQNTRGNLQSFNVPITERVSGATTQPAVSSIIPATVNQGNTPQTITINGANFDSSSIIEVQAPNGQSFQVMPSTISRPGEEARIISITSTAITAIVPFSFSNNYGFTVINLSTFGTSGPCLTLGCQVNAILGATKTPVILIPGGMGSSIAKRNGNSFEELFPAGLHPEKHIQLKESVGLDVSIENRPIVATDIVRQYAHLNFYGDLIDTLTGPYSGYKLYAVDNPRQRTLAGCDLTSLRNLDANFYIFPYDWRNGNAQSAKDLKDYVQCIRQRHGGSSNPNFKVNIIAHSQGGLVARRYILDGLYSSSPYTPYVDKLVTLGTPWLGAPKFILALETGAVDGISTGYLKLMSQLVLKDIARYMPGPHELLPSRVYSDELRDTTLGDFPFGENGWNFNGFNGIERMYNFDAFEEIMNRHQVPNTEPPHNIVLPGTNTDTFHNKRYPNNRPLQDNWTGDQTGVTYYNFIGRCVNNQGGFNTIGSVIATHEWYMDWLGIWKEKYYLNPIMTRGDCTVPEISSTRQSSNGNYLGPAIPRVFPNVSHSGLPNDPHIVTAIDCLFSDLSPSFCLNQSAGALTPEEADHIVDLPAYNLNILGSTMVSITDSFGNTTSPFSTSSDEGVATISTNVTGDDFLNALIPLDQNYKVVLRTSNSPLVVTITKNEGQDTILAIRYLDLSIPPGLLAELDITPQGVGVLKYDSDGDGTFDTPVTPTVVVTGPDAADIEPPHINVNETVQVGTSRIDLEAIDTGTGVQRIMYSLNGTTFQQYSTPLTLNAVTTPTIYAFADDNVFNRSGLVTHTLTTSNVGFSVVGPTIASTGGLITANWNAPGGRPVDDWIGLFQIGELNSRFIAKQYTNGLPSGGLTFTAPNQSGLYEFRYLVNDSFSSVAVSNTINVISNRRAPFDFDGDAKTDPAVFRPTNGYWYLLQSTAGFLATPFGTNGDRLVPGDYDNDGKTDTAVWRPSNGYWYILPSSDGAFRAVPFGQLGDIPAAGDYDGDRKTDIAVWRPSNGYFYLLLSSDGSFQFKQWGQAGDMPVMGDYDGDGKTDFAVFRPSIGTFYVLRSSDGGVVGQQFGQSGDKPIAGDFDGDGKTDLAVFRPSNSSWYWLQSSDNGFRGVAWGTSGDIPSAGDYDGDGKWDVAVFRPSSGTFYILQSTTNALRAEQFGTNGDVPVPSAYVP